MKKLITILNFVLAASAFAGVSLTTDTDGNILTVPKQTFFERNVRVFRQDFRLFIDTTPSLRVDGFGSKTRTNTNIFYYKDASGNLVRTVNSVGNSMPTFTTYSYVQDIQYWTDCEIKVIDKWGNLIYFTSTIALDNQQVQMLHPTLTDKTPKVFYWETAYENSTGGCWGERKQFTLLNASIGATKLSGTCVSGIWIYPALDSTEKRTIPVFTGANAYTNKQVVWGEYVRSVFDNPDNTVLCWRQTPTYGEIYYSKKIWRPVRIEYYGNFKEIK